MQIRCVLNIYAHFLQDNIKLYFFLYSFDFFVKILDVLAINNINIKSCFIVHFVIFDLWMFYVLQF